MGGAGARTGGEPGRRRRRTGKGQPQAPQQTAQPGFGEPVHIYPPNNPYAPPREDGEIHPEHVRGQVWVLTGEPGGSNVVVQVGDQGVFVVDTGTKEMAPKLLAADPAARTGARRRAQGNPQDTEHQRTSRPHWRQRDHRQSRQPDHLRRRTGATTRLRCPQRGGGRA